jgi:hypothetical protein
MTERTIYWHFAVSKLRFRLFLIRDNPETGGNSRYVAIFANAIRPIRNSYYSLFKQSEDFFNICKNAIVLRSKHESRMDEIFEIHSNILIWHISLRWKIWRKRLSILLIWVKRILQKSTAMSTEMIIVTKRCLITGMVG